MTGRRRVLLFLIAAALLLPAFLAQGAGAEQMPLRLAFLGVRLQNDNAGFEPTTDAERNREAMIATQFTSAAVASGGYTIVPLTDKIQSQIANGQAIGSCGGCEASIGRELKTDRVAWIMIQKVSNLILNINLYIADPATDKYTFVKSVDIRGNTDESWSRSLKYLLDNYFFTQKS